MRLLRGAVGENARLAPASTSSSGGNQTWWTSDVRGMPSTHEGYRRRVERSRGVRRWSRLTNSRLEWTAASAVLSRRGVQDGTRGRLGGHSAAESLGCLTSMSAPTEVWSTFLDADGWPRRRPVPANLVRRWFSAAPLEARGTLFQCLRNPDCRASVAPPRSPQELFDFYVSYFESCISADPNLVKESRWVLAPGDLSRFIAQWLQEVWRSKSADHVSHDAIVSWLERILLQYPGFAALLSVNVADILFTSARVRRRFLRWRAHPVLGPLFPQLRG